MQSYENVATIKSTLNKRRQKWNKLYIETAQKASYSGSGIGLGFLKPDVPAKTGKHHTLLYAVRKQ